MFRRLSSSLPKDPVFPVDLTELGYFLNENDQIRQIAKPEDGFEYKISRNDRTNEMQKEAMNECIRRLVAERLPNLGLKIQRLPRTAGPTDPHIPIWISSNISDAKRIVLYVGERSQDLGILAYRKIHDSVNAGSIYDFAEAVLETKVKEEEAPGLVVANPGQLLWYRGGERAVTMSSWYNLPRRTAVHPVMRIDEERNKIPGHGIPSEHIATVFEDILNQTSKKSDAEVDVVAVGDGGYETVLYLSQNWTALQSKISSLVLVEPQHSSWELEPSSTSDTDHDEFLHFLSTRARAYCLSDEVLGTPVPGRRAFGCNCYAGGEDKFVELIMPAAWRNMLRWIISRDDEGQNEVDEVREEDAASEDGWEKAWGNDQVVIKDSAGKDGVDVEVNVVSPEEFKRLKEQVGQV